MSDTTELESEIAALAHAAALKRVDAVTPDMRLRADLGVDGDAARDFIGAFAARYEVDLDRLVWRRFFREEGFDPLAPALAFWLRRLDRDFAYRWSRAEDAEREISIAHLARVAETKKWFDPGAEAKPANAQNHVGFLILRGVLSLAPIALVLTLPVLLVLMVLLAAMSGNWNVLMDNWWLVIFMAGLVGLQGWIARNSWRSIERKLASVPEPA
ncbi:hypothetical protein [Terricaulis sp.]|uniref:hypothetical protein n=1 Tax=Terricaulis sp. TaxID=2768686 RepID=UPI003782FD1B